MFRRGGTRGNRRGVGGSAPAFLPTGIPDLDLWLRSDLGVSTSGSNVTAWANQAPTGSSRDVAQGTASFQPTLQAAVLNGHSVVRFDGTDDGLISGNVDWTGVAGCTVFAVYKNATAPAVADQIVTKGTITVDNGFEFNAQSDQSQQLTIFTAGNYNGRRPAANSCPAGTWRIGSATGDPTLTGADEIETWLHGVLQGKDTAVAVGAVTSIAGNNPYAVGYRQSGLYYFDGDIAEIIVYTRVLSTAERRRVELYLARRYAIVTDQTFTAPTQLPNLHVWYHAGAGITKDSSDRVSAWADQSGAGDSGRNAAQGTASRQPLWLATDADMNGRPTVDFDAARDDELPSGVWSASMPAVSTWAAAGKIDTGGSTRMMFDGDHVTNRHVLYHSGTTQMSLYQSAALSSPASFAPPKAMAIVGRYNGALSQLYINAQTAVATGDVGSASMASINIGNVYTAYASPFPWDGPIGEIAGYARLLSLAEKTLLLDYLGAKYGITIGA